MIEKPNVDFSEPLEWMVLESQVVMSQQRTGPQEIFSIKHMCVKYDIKLNEKFFVTNGTCSALSHRIELLHGNGAKPIDFLKRPLTFYAQTYPYLTGDGKVLWMFDPFTFSRDAADRTTSMSDTQHIESVVQQVIDKKLSRKDSLAELEQHGPKFVKRFRELVK